MDSSTVNGTVFISALSFCFVYVFISALFEHKRVLSILLRSISFTRLGWPCLLASWWG